MNARRRLLQAVLAGGVGPAAATLPPTLGGALVDRELRLGDTAVRLRRRASPAGGGLLLLNLHEDESTSVRAAEAVLAHRPGELLTLHAQGRRLVRFFIGWRPCVFDPNRIFTEPGLARTLARHGSATPAAAAAVRRLRDVLLAELADAAAGPVVALHNNGAGDYGAGSYRPGARLARDAARCALPRPEAGDDFFLVTTADWFDALAARGFNVVLQSASPDDDGSLSVWFGQRKRPYVNIEARHGRLEPQRRMVEAVLEVADALAPPRR